MVIINDDDGDVREVVDSKLDGIISDFDVTDDEIEFVSFQVS